MTDLGNRYALSALKAKRAELAGEIAVLKRKLDWAETSLRHIDASLNIFDPTGDPSQIPDKRPQKRMKLFRQGQLGAMILKELTQSLLPLNTSEIIHRLIASKNWSETARAGLAPRIRSNLSYLAATGRVVKTGNRQTAKWAPRRKILPNRSSG